MLNKAILDMSEKVSKVLNNTPVMARDSYISPKVWEKWRKTIEAA